MQTTKSASGSTIIPDFVGSVVIPKLPFTGVEPVGALDDTFLSNCSPTTLTYALLAFAIPPLIVPFVIPSVFPVPTTRPE